MNSNIFTQVLTLLRVKYSERYANNLFINQPYRNTLYGIGLLLDHYNIGNECLQLQDKRVLKNSLTPIIIAYQGRFYILTSVGNKSILLLDAGGEEIELNRSEFLSQWDGIGLFIFPNKNSMEPDYKKHNAHDKVLNLKNLVLLVSSITLVLLAYIHNLTYTTYSYSIILIPNILGTYITYLLLQEELSIKNNIADKLCSIIKEHGCEKVTKSTAASLFGIAKLSEIGFAYFNTNILALLLDVNSLPYISLFAIIVLPFTLWSIWYQKYRIKSWCTLCLITVCTLWLQAILCMILRTYQFENFNIIYFISVGISYIIGILFINKVIPFIKAKKESLIWKLEYESLKVQDKVIEAFTKDFPTYDITTDNCSSIIFGNPNSKYKITIFSNPYCQPCAKMHKRLNDIITQDVCIQYVFTSFSNQLENINKFIIAFYKKFGAEQCWKMLTDWYESGKDQNEEFFAPFDLNIERNDVTYEFHKHFSWREGKPFPGTPTILVNGKTVSSPYSVEDYLYLTK